MRNKEEIENYNNKMKRTKIVTYWHSIKIIKEIKEDNHNIARYLGLDENLCRQVNWYHSNYGLFSQAEYLELVEIMELNKSSNTLYPYVQFQFCIDDVRNVQLKMENAVMSLTGNGPLLIYDLYLHFLMDTRNVRQAFKEPPFKSVLNRMKEELNEKINNRIRNSGEYFGKYFETGKRYFAKRNNLKILLSNYLKFVGKIVVLYKRNKKIT
jgi:hypothetical protein